jgi:hypothetical protein
MLFLLKDPLQYHLLHYQRLLDHKENHYPPVVLEVVEVVGKVLLVQLV